MISRNRLKTLGSSLLLWAAVSAVVISMSLSPPAIIFNAILSIIDMWYPYDERGESSDIPVLIDIDERSLAELGQWSWPRSTTARIIDELTDAGVLAICADYLPAEPDRMSPDTWSDKFEQLSGTRIDMSGVPEEWRDFDEIFAESLRRAPIVIGAELTHDPRDRGTAFVRSFPIREVRDFGARPLVDHLMHYEGIISPIPSAARAARCCGLMNAEPSHDGIYRALPAFLEFNGRPIASLFLSALAIAHGDEELVVRVGTDGPRSVRVGGVDVPLDRKGLVYISFTTAQRAYDRYSACDVFAGRVPRSALEGRIAFLGSTAFGLNDLRPTPVDPFETGIELSVAAADTILSRRFLRRADDEFAVNTAVVMGIGLICVLLFTLAPPSLAISLATCIAVVVWSVCFRLFTRHGLIFQPVFPIASIVLCSISAFAARYFVEHKEKVLLRSAFSNYVSPDVVSSIVSAGDISRITGETREITVLFTDIRGFTTMTERMHPDAVVGLLDSYFTPMTSIVRSTRGTIDKFIGDALMAFWNAPLDVPDHERAALKAYMMMRESLIDMEDDLKKKFGASIRIGAGICSGPAHVGNMGTRELVSYTALGDTVNTASRLEGMNKVYGVDVVLSEDAARKCAGEWRMQLIDRVRLKGRDGATSIFTAIEPREAERRAAELDKWEKAFEMYTSGDFEGTFHMCNELLVLDPGTRLYRVFSERSRMLALDPPADWDGVHSHTTK